MTLMKNRIVWIVLSVIMFMASVALILYYLWGNGYLWKAKKGIKEAYEIFEDMKDEFSERGDRYSERYNQHGYNQRGYDERGDYYGREWDDMHERRGYRR